MPIILENIDETTTVNLQNVVEENAIIIEENTENTTIILQEGEEVFLPITATFAATSNVVNSGEAITFTWTSENASKVLLQGVEVPLNGSKDITFNESSEVVFIAYNGDFQVSTSEIISVIQPDDERITYANRIAEDGGEIVGFDQLEDNINAPVGRKVGKLYGKNGDDYSVVANGERYEFAREGFYRKVAANVPRFDWANGKQELLREGQATNINNFSVGSVADYYTFTPNVEDDNRTLLGIGNKSFRFNSVGNYLAYIYLRPSISNTITLTLSIYVEMDDGMPPNISNSNPETPFRLVICNTLAEEVFEKRIYGNVWRVYGYATVSSSSLTGILRYPSNIDRGFTFSQMQLEEGTQPSSPILTNGSIVTRPADIITNSQGQLAVGRYDSV